MHKVINPETGTVVARFDDEFDAHLFTKGTSFEVAQGIF